MFKNVLKIAISTFLMLNFLIFQVNSVYAQGVLIINTDLIQQDNTYVYDGDDSGGDITLQFGNSLGEYLQWDSAGSSFQFSDDLDLENNQLLNTRIENLSSAPTCDSSLIGKVYHNTIDTYTYVCDGTIWKQLEDDGSAHIQNTDTGTTNGIFTLDSDDSETDISLQFGSSLGEYLKWDGTNDKFIFSDDLDLENNQLINARIENLSSAPTCDSNVNGKVYHNITDTFTYVCDGTTWKQIDTTGGGGNLANHEVGSTILTSTTNATPTTIADLTYTPAAGTWLVSLSATGQGTNTGQDMEYGLYLNGTVINNTERKLDLNSGAQGDQLWFTLHSQAIVTVNGTDIIDARYWTGSGTFYIEDRNLVFVRLGD